MTGNTISRLKELAEAEKKESNGAAQNRTTNGNRHKNRCSVTQFIWSGNSMSIDIIYMYWLL